MISKQQGQLLISLARASIAEALGYPSKTINTSPEDTNWLKQDAACFVTLTLNEQLRGCIGSLEAHRPLLNDIQHNARAAAFEDPRFRPLSSTEFEDIEIEVSLLSPMHPLTFETELEALEQLQPGIDGVIFEYGRYRSTFLPQVWEQLPSTRDFMAHLKQKAGLGADFWADEIRLSRYSVTKWKEHEPGVEPT